MSPLSIQYVTYGFFRFFIFIFLSAFSCSISLFGFVACTFIVAAIVVVAYFYVLSNQNTISPQNAKANGCDRCDIDVDTWEIKDSGIDKPICK